MKKIVLFLLITTIILSRINAQTISPLTSSEQCPGVLTNFSVSIPGTSLTNITGWAISVAPSFVSLPSNVVVSGGYITFNFTARFADYNNKQTIRVSYKDASGADATHDFTYPKIKSLLTGAYASQILPSPTTITAARCQSQNFNVSFTNIPYSNPWVSPSITYGTVTTYEYLLPSGWSIGATTSNGTGWIAGGNNVTVTSDLTTGDGSYIHVRPINTACGTGLAKGQESLILISRPAPILYIAGSTSAICSGSSNYTLSGVPSGATVSWSISDPTEASVSPSPTDPLIAIVTRTGSGDLNTTLTATVTSCSVNYTTTRSVVLGTPAPADIVGIIPGTNFTESQTIYLNIDEEGSSYTWSVYGGSVVGSSSSQNIAIKLQSCWINQHTLNDFYVSVNYTNACGTSIETGEGTHVVCTDGDDPEDPDPLRVAITPNPAKPNSSVKLSFDPTQYSNDLNKGETATVKLYDFSTAILIKEWKVNSAMNNESIKLNGIKKGRYIIIVQKGNHKQIKHLLID